jgi:hypothetical protein
MVENGLIQMKPATTRNCSGFSRASIQFNASMSSTQSSTFMRCDNSRQSGPAASATAAPAIQPHMMANSYAGVVINGVLVYMLTTSWVTQQLSDLNLHSPAHRGDWAA